MCIVNDLRVSAEENNVPVLVLLDLCAVFHTVDHSLLLDEKKWVRLSGNVLKWFYSYLLFGKFFISCGDYLNKKNLKYKFLMDSHRYPYSALFCFLCIQFSFIITKYFIC